MTYRTTDGVLLSIVKAGQAVKSDGDTDGIAGYFSVVEIPYDEAKRATMREAVFPQTEVEQEEDYMTPPEIFDLMPAGWYLLTQRRGGNVFATGCEDEAFILAEFAENQEEHRLGW